MSKDDNTTQHEVIDFKSKKKTQSQTITPQSAEQESIKEALELGMEAMEDAIDQGAKGFLTVMFDEEGNPYILHAGELDIFATMGVLDFAKMELLSFSTENLDVE